MEFPGYHSIRESDSDMSIPVVKPARGNFRRRSRAHTHLAKAVSISSSPVIRTKVCGWLLDGDGVTYRRVPAREVQMIRNITSATPMMPLASFFVGRK
jgi:hypothetical protein